MSCIVVLLLCTVLQIGVRVSEAFAIEDQLQNPGQVILGNEAGSPVGAFLAPGPQVLSDIHQTQGLDGFNRAANLIGSKMQLRTTLKPK